MQEIETPRLHLRPIQYEDLDALAELHADPLVTQYIGSGKPRSRSETEANLKRLITQWEEHGFGMWAMFNKADGSFVGRGGLIYLGDTPEVEVGYALAQSFWGKGLATELTRASLSFGFSQLGLERIVGITYPQNIASQKVLQKNGLKFEKVAFYYGVNVNYYAISREAFYLLV